MFVYIAACESNDPDSEPVLGECRTEVLGVFSTPELAAGSFDREEPRTSPEGEKWTTRHTCYRGRHVVRRMVLDEWRGSEEETRVKGCDE